MKIRVLLCLLLTVAGIDALAGGIQAERVAGMVRNVEYNRVLLRLLDGRAEPIDVDSALVQQQGGDALFLDARQEGEFQVSRIPGALHIGYEKPDYSALEGVPESRLLIVYCSVGYRSERRTSRG